MGTSSGSVSGFWTNGYSEIAILKHLQANVVHYAPTKFGLCKRCSCCPRDDDAVRARDLEILGALGSSLKDL